MRLLRVLSDLPNDANSSGYRLQGIVLSQSNDGVFGGLTVF